MTRPGAIPPVLRAALDWPSGRCYRHCDRPVRPRRFASALPGTWTVRACPSGVVSVTSYAERTSRNPTADVRRYLERGTVPPRLVRAWDLRLATRRGPELGRAAERFLARARPRRGVRVVYWRVYPFRARDGSERRLFVCFRTRHAGPVFFAADPAKGPAVCPRCGPRPRARRRAA